MYTEEILPGNKLLPAFKGLWGPLEQVIKTGPTYQVFAWIWLHYNSSVNWYPKDIKELIHPFIIKKGSLDFMEVKF